MAELTQQQLIDNLILAIETAEDPQSVTNEIVARVFDFLNKGCKRLDPIDNRITQEVADRQAADNALNNTINALVNGNATAAIENFNEVITFLNGVTDDKKLTGLLNELREGIVLNSQNLDTLDQRESGDVQRLEESIALLEAKQVMGITLNKTTGILSLHYDNNSNVTNATLGEDGKLKITYQI